MPFSEHLRYWDELVSRDVMHKFISQSLHFTSTKNVSIFKFLIFECTKLSREMWGSNIKIFFFQFILRISLIILYACIYLLLAFTIYVKKYIEKRSPTSKYPHKQLYAEIFDGSLSLLSLQYCTTIFKEYF